MSGPATTFALLGRTENDAAVPLLAVALDSTLPDVRQGAVRAVLERRATSLMRVIVERVEQWDDSTAKLVGEYHGRMAPVLRDYFLSGRKEQVTLACRACVRFREYDLFPILINAVEDDRFPFHDAAATALADLAEELWHELAVTRDERLRRDPQIARKNATLALEQSLGRFPQHNRKEPIEAFLQLAARDNAALSRMLSDPRDPCFAAIVDTLLASERHGVWRLLLGFLDDQRPPIAALQTLFRRGDGPFLDLLLKKIGDDSTTTERANLRRVDAVSWLGDHTLLTELNEAQQQVVVVLIQGSGLKKADAFQALDFLAEHGHPAARAAAVAAMADVRGPDAVRRVLRSLHDGDPRVRAAALVQLRSRAVPGALATLITALDSDDAAVVDAARSQLQEFCFRRFLPSFDLLEEDVRRTTGQLVAKVDPTSVDQLREELRSSQPRRRVRGLETAAAMDLVDALVGAILDCTTDEDQAVRLEAARALGQSTAPPVVIALRQMRHDASFSVREAAQDSLERVERGAPMRQVFP